MAKKKTEQTVETEVEETLPARLFSVEIALPEQLLVEAGPSQSRSKWLFPFLAVLAFFMGVLLFFPIDTLAERSLLSFARSAALPLHFDEIDVSLLGDYQLTGFSLPMPVTEGKKISLKISSLEGELSLPALLFGPSLDSNHLARGLKVEFDKLLLQGGEWNLKLLLQHLLRPSGEWQGNLLLKAEKMQVIYNDDLPFLNSHLEALVESLELKADISENTLRLSASELRSSLARIIVQGEVRFTDPGQLSLRVTIYPTAQFFERYRESGIRELLTQMQILQADGKIELEIRGSLRQPQVISLKGN